MSRAEWYAAPVLLGEGVTLTPLRLTDAAAYLAALGPPSEAAEVTAHLSFRPPADVAEAGRVIAAALADPDRIPYAQRLADGTLVGTTSFYEVAPATRSIAIGHTWLGRRHWRSGINTAAKLVLMRRAFEGLGAERVVWHTDIRNVRSQDAIRRLGAQREGVLRHHRIRPDGSWRDTVQFAMLAAEWPIARQRLQDRLVGG